MKNRRVEKPGTLGGYDYGTAKDAHEFCASFLAHHPGVSFNDVARVSRWRGLMLEEFEELKTVPAYGKYMICAKAVERYFGMKVVDIALDAAIRSRGILSRKDVKSQFDYTLDVDYGTTCKRKRNTHEKEVSDFYLRGVFDLISIAFVPNGKRAAAFIKRFWRPGDFTLTDAVRRAVKSACA